MSATQKELRQAFKAGLVLMQRYKNSSGSHMDDRMMENEARVAYPPKTVTRPRELTFDGTRWRVGVNGLEWNCGGWYTSGPFGTPGGLTALRDLLANPTETVESDE